MTARYTQVLIRLGLTSGQAEVAALICDGLTEAQVAARLHRSKATIHVQMTKTYVRLSVHNHLELLRLVHENLHRIIS